MTERPILEAWGDYDPASDQPMRECSDCRGRGGEEKYLPDDPLNKLMHGSHWYRCQHCNGTGEVPDEREPLPDDVI